MSLLEVKGVKRSYGNLQVLRGIDMVIRRGEVVAIVGASGAGKSTLLHVLGTLDKPDAGTVFFDSKNLFTMNERELAEFRNKHIGFVFQFHNLLGEFTALENVCMPAYIGKWGSESEIQEKGKALLAVLGLQERDNHLPSQLSGGEQQRVAVARALINSPDVIFADEPSGNLDSRNAEELHKLFFELRKEMGCTFVIVTHNEHLAEMADRRLMMKDGLLVSN